MYKEVRKREYCQLLDRIRGSRRNVPEDTRAERCRSEGDGGDGDVS
jgi:hypothetical protein